MGSQSPPEERTENVKSTEIQTIRRMTDAKDRPV